MLSNAIKNLLKLHGRIIVPDFGAFIYKGGPFPTIYFNEFLRYDDSILLDYLVETDKIDKNAASEKINAFVDSINKQLSASKPVELEGLGTLIKDSNDKIQLKTANIKANNFETPVPVEKDPEPREVYFEIEKTEVSQPVVEKKPVEPEVQPKVETTVSSKTQTNNAETTTENIQQVKLQPPPIKTTTEVQQKQQQPSQPYRTPPPKKPIVQEEPPHRSSKGWAFFIFLIIAGGGVYFGYYNPVWKKWIHKNQVQTKDTVSRPKITLNPQKESEETPEKQEETQNKPVADKPVTETKAASNQVSENKAPVTKPTQPEIKKSTVSAGGKKFRLVAGSFSVEANADKMVQKLKAEGFDAEKFVSSKNKFFYVSYGSYGDRAEATQEMNRLKAGGKENIWILGD
jgi:nucleoid DNA-binding protein